MHELLRLGGGPLQEGIIIGVHREGVRREGSREGLHRPAVDDRATGDLLAEPQERGHLWARGVSPEWRARRAVRGSRRESKKIFRPADLD